MEAGEISTEFVPRGKEMDAEVGVDKGMKQNEDDACWDWLKS